MENRKELLPFSQSAALPVGRPGRVVAAETEATPAPPAVPEGRIRLRQLMREWLLDLKVLGRSPATLDWYEQKLCWYLDHGGVDSLEALIGFELKRWLAEQQGRGLAENTVKGTYITFKAFANWAMREGYPVDSSLLRVRPPKVAQVEMESFTGQQLQAILASARPGWPRLAVQILLGTGMRASELCALTLDDVEIDDDGGFLKVRRGKGAKFRRIPISHNLQRELSRYVNRTRPQTGSQALLVVGDGRPVSVETLSRMLQRLKRAVGFRVHAHKFRHTFASEYLRRGGEIERLRRILGHSSYATVMRYVHFDKGDLSRDFDQRTPF